jgi:hypothetical protein
MSFPARRRVLHGLAVTGLGLALPRRARSTAADAVDTRQWDGVLYGCPVQGDTVAPTQIKTLSSGVPVPTWLTFPAKRTGRIVAVRQILRAALKAREIHNSPGDYSRGDGGRITLQIRPLGADGRPTSTILGRTAVNNGWGTLCVDGVGRYDQYGLWTFQRPVPVTRGQGYCFYWENTSTTGGWVSIDYMICYADVPLGLDPPQHAGIYYGDDCQCYGRYGSTIDDAGYRANQGGMWDLHYEDGINDGNPYYFAKSQARKTAGGAVMVRQRFTVDDYTRVVDGLWFRCWWTSASTTDLVIRLEEADGRLVERLTVPRESITRTNAYAGSPPALWTKVAFASARTLTLGKTYHLCFGAAGGGYEFCPVFAYPAATSRNVWKGAYCQYTTADGARWHDGWHRSDQPDRRLRELCLSVAFTVRS